MKAKKVSNDQEKDVLRFVQSIAGEDALRVEEDIGGGYVLLKISEAEKRQAKHDIRLIEDTIIELLRNARDAEAKTVYVAFSKKSDYYRNIVVVDDGSGIAAKFHKRIFEPRVTSKLDSLVIDKYGVHGRGMALFSIKSSVKTASVVNSFSGQGSVFKIIADTRMISERKDQSSYPILRKRDGKLKVVRGPHNILRLLTEFNLEHPGLDVYLGSPAEVFATMYHHSRKWLESNRIKVASIENHVSNPTAKMWHYAGFAKDTDKLAQIAKYYYGFDISSRNAHRILCGDIKPKPCIIEEVSGKRMRFQESVDINSERRKDISENLAKRVSNKDLQTISHKMSAVFEQIGLKYFLRIQGNPKVWRGNDDIKICFKLESDQED